MGDITEYNKAVRDKIPEIIRSQGKQCTTKTVDDPTFLRYLEYKLLEELEEYLELKKPEELADLMEVILRVAELKGMSREDLEALRARKADERGGFANNQVLQSVEGEEKKRKFLLGTCERSDYVYED
ncbi:MAG: nucleoside triphosphate pyrophosphohydrolase [Methanomicrobiaceae archaeon]|nr:nucleoside triphosphate pyrophosphohydrolase [Methanomicrobiaceae archaeon]